MTDATSTKITASQFYELFEESNQPIELIEGEVIVSPAPTYDHQRVVSRINWLISSVVNPADLGDVVVAPHDVYLDDDNVFQPDVFFVAKDNPRTTLSENNYLYGSPDLCVEILSPSTAKRDRTVKFNQYAQHGVKEYWIVDPNFQVVEVYVLKENQFVLHGVYDADDPIRSTILPMLDFKVSEMFPKR